MHFKPYQGPDLTSIEHAITRVNAALHLANVRGDEAAERDALATLTALRRRDAEARGWDLE